jgi:hypothetical protein
MSRQNPITEWLRSEMAKPGRSQQGLADALGRDRAVANRLLQGKRALKAAEVPLVERYFQQRAPETVMSFTDGPPVAPSDFTSIPVYDMRLGLEDGEKLSDAKPVRYMMMDRARLALMKADPFSVVGFDNNLEELLVDMSRCDPRYSGLYVLRIDSVLTSAMTAFNPGRKTLQLTALGPNPAVFNDINPDDLEVIGRVIWTGTFLG